MLPASPSRIAKRHGSAPSLCASKYQCLITLLALLITCCPALAIAAKPNMAGDYVGQLPKCVWIDKYGYGNLELNVDERFTEFYGE